MSGPDTDTQWFIARDGKQHGPVSDIELRKLIELSHLKSTDLVWRQGFSDWRTAASVFPEVAEPAAPEPATAPPTAATKTSSVTTGRPAASSSAPAAGPASTTKPADPGPQASTPTTSSTLHGPGPAAAQPAGYTPYAPAQAHPAPGPRLSPGGLRPEPMATRPLGSAPRMGAGYPGPEPRLTTDSRKPSEMTSPVGPGDGAPPRPKRRKLAVAAGLLVMTGVGAWIASQYTDTILAVMQSGNGGATETAVVANVIPPDEGPPAAAAEVAPVAAAPTPEDIDRTLQGRNVWISVKQEFPDWYQTRVAEVTRLTAEKKDQAEITRYLIGELVKLRRENAKHALAASTTRHKELAAAFLANLQQLSREGGDGCYDFISKGESSAVIVARMQDPSKSAEIETQLVAIITAIVEGRKAPAEHAAPVKTDYDLLAGELGRLGWTQADMQLFANPKALAQAPRDRVCNMLKDWFTAHLAIQDPSSQARLLYETLKPVVSG